MRPISEKELCHERLGDQFAEELSKYDTQRRVETLVGEFLDDGMVKGRRALDVGCGLGFFSKALVARGATVSACDLGPGLVERTRAFAGCEAAVADVMELGKYYPPSSFDLVVSSECIEHTPDPREAIRQMALVLRPGGYLSLSTPNRVWQPVVRAATALRLRCFDGNENFLSWRRLRKCLDPDGLIIIREQGLHLFPFQFHAHGLSRWCDRHMQGCSGLMINMCILARKRE